MPRTDRKSSSYLSTAIYAVFISIFLFGVYMMTSTTVIPVNMVPAVDKNKPEIREEVQMDDTRTSEDTNIGDANDDSEDKMSRENEAIQEDSAVETEKGNESSTNVNFEDEKTQVADGENTAENETENGLKPKSDQTEIQKKEEKGVDVSAVELLTETNSTNGDWKSQTEESKKEKEQLEQSSSKGVDIVEYSWKLCNTAAGADYIPCLDNIKAIKQLHSTKHYEHRERHCPEESPACLVPLPEGYRRSIKWPKSRDKIWFYNVPHTQLVKYKGHQNWVKVDGDYLTFPGGGTQFKYGALHYIDTIQSAYPDIAWGKRSRVILDVGCGVASFGGYMFERDVLTMSFAPKDEHEAQVQFALERGIPAISAVMGTKRLPFPSRVYDVVHCARCRVPWHIEGGMLLLELNRLLRPGGYFVWSATPVYQKLPEDAGIWKAMSDLTKSMCWEMVKKTKDKVNRVGFAIFRKPVDNKCYEQRSQNTPPLCQESDEPNAAWNVPLQACMHRVPVDSNMRGSQWPEQWPQRLEATPYWLNSSETGVYGKSAPEDFEADYQHWKQVVEKSYLSGMRIDWSNVRNVMDMSSIYGGFAAALRERKVWVMNVVTVDSPDTLPIIFERGLFGIYHDWCESFSTYPRTYDLLHADHLFSKIKKRCKILPVIAEVDRVLRPKGNLIVRDNKETIQEIEAIAKSLHWNVQMTYFQGTEGLLYAQKMMWRPQETETSI